MLSVTQILQTVLWGLTFPTARVFCSLTSVVSRTKTWRKAKYDALRLRQGSFIVVHCQPYWMATKSCKWNRAIYQDTNKNAPLKQWSLSLFVSPALFSTCSMKYSSSAWSERSYFDDTARRRIMETPQFSFVLNKFKSHKYLMVQTRCHLKDD